MDLLALRGRPSGVQAGKRSRAYRGSAPYCSMSATWRALEMSLIDVLPAHQDARPDYSTGNGETAVVGIPLATMSKIFIAG